MKKVLVVIGFLIGIMGVKANGISDYKITWLDGTYEKEILLEDKFISSYRAFLLSPNLEYEIIDKRLINNLAYLGKDSNNGLFLATLQLLIWENTTNVTSYEIKDNLGNIVDITEIVRYIQEKLKEFDITNDLDGNYYEVEYGKSLELRGQIPLGNYSTNVFRNENYGSFIRLSNFYKVGLWKVKFDNNIRRNDQYVYAPTPAYKPFEIMVKVLGNVVSFNVNAPKNLNYNLVFDVYTIDGDYLKQVEINDNNKELHYALGQDISLIEVTDNPIFNLEKEIYIYENEKHEYEININKELQKFEIIIGTKYVNSELKNEFETDTDVIIYDLDFNYIADCKSENTCKIVLDAGKYFFKDNKSGLIALYEVLENCDIDIYRYTIKGIITNDVIESNDLEMIKINNGYLFKEEIVPDVYDFLINDINYKVNLNQKENWLKIENYGLFYKLESLNEKVDFVEKDEIIDSVEDDKGIFNEETIEVFVPDTGIDYNFNWGWFDDKKRYNVDYCLCFVRNIYRCK